MAAIAPGPPGHWLWGHLQAFRNDELSLVLDSARVYGDIVRFRLGPVVVHLLNHPDHLEHVLVRRSHNYLRHGRSASYISEVCGPSLLTTDGAFWRERRRLMQPVFHRQRVAALADVMAHAAGELVERWSGSAKAGAPVNVASEMSRVAFAIAGRALFGEDVRGEAEVMETALGEVLTQTFGRVQGIVSWPRWCPTAGNRRFKSALADIDRVVYQIIERRRSQPSEQGDLLSLLLAARAAEGGEFSDLDLRNETVTLLLAGHETTANALAWTFYLLAQHADVQERVREEVFAERAEPVDFATARLAFLAAVFQESMRLYPPIWIMERQVVERDEINGFVIPARSMVVISPWALHRHPDFWDEPEAFRPERFEKEPAAYVPFGLGPHQCIGRHFAWLEAQTILAKVVRHFRWRMDSNLTIRPKGGITLRQEPGVQVRLERL